MNQNDICEGDNCRIEGKVEHGQSKKANLPFEIATAIAICLFSK